MIDPDLLRGLVIDRANQRDGSQARTGIGGGIDDYDTSRPHSVFDGRTP